MLRRVRRLSVLLALAYAFLHVYPQMLFAHSISERGVTLDSTRPIPANAAERLAKAHGLIRRRLGLWRSLRTPNWIVEGYCDYVAGGGSFPEEEGDRILAAGETDPSHSFRYFRYCKRGTQLIEDQGLSFDALAEQGGGADDR